MTETANNELQPITFDRLKASFERRQSQSKAPAILLKEEIEYIEKLLDSNAPRVPFVYCDLTAVRRAYHNHIIEGNPMMWQYARAKHGDEIALWSTGLQAPSSAPLPPKNEDITDFSKAKKYKLVPPSKENIIALNVAEAFFYYLQWLRKLERPDGNETIIHPMYLQLIFKRYGYLFEGETEDTWLLRFCKRSINIPQINIEMSVREGNNRLVLIAILASIQRATGNAFDFEHYVRSHFGIEGFESAKSRHKDKNTFTETERYCKGVLNK
jgi:hypothetical protein